MKEPKSVGAKLTIEQAELLSELLESPALSALWFLTDDILTNMQDRLINTPLSSTNEKDLLITKARVDGASVFLEALKQRLSKERSRT
jgi:hypothetical protein